MSNCKLLVRLRGCRCGCPNGKGRTNVHSEPDWRRIPLRRCGALRTTNRRSIVFGLVRARVVALRGKEFGPAIMVAQRRTERRHHLKLHRGQVTAAACVRLGPTPTYAKRRRGDQAQRRVDGRNRNLDLADDRAPRIHSALGQGRSFEGRLPSCWNEPEGNWQKTLEGANPADDRGVAKVRPHRRGSLVAGGIVHAGTVRRIRATTARALAVAWSPQGQELMRIDDSFCLTSGTTSPGRLDEPSHDAHANARRQRIGGGRVAQLSRGCRGGPWERTGRWRAEPHERRRRRKARRSGHDSAGALAEKTQEKASALLIHFTDNQYARNFTNHHHSSTDRAGIRPRQPARARSGAISQGGQGGRSCCVHRGELGFARDGVLDDCVEWRRVSGAAALLVASFWQRPAVSSQSERPPDGHAGRSPNATSGQRERASSSIACLVAVFLTRGTLALAAPVKASTSRSPE